MSVVYLDHAATTAMSPAAIEAYAQVAAEYGNASSQHTMGRTARRIVEESREQIAGLLGSRPSEVIFTSGGTEADNLAIKGRHFATAPDGRNRVVVSAIEHHAVLDPTQWLVKYLGAATSMIPVDESGLVRLDALAELLASRSDDISVISVMWANNEVGTVQPISRIVELANEHGLPVHSDAVQAVGALPVNFAASGLSAMTVGAHKIGGPVGVGALIAARDLSLVELTSGGGQERSVRSGTLDAAGIRSFAVALDETVSRREAEARRLATLRDYLVARVRAEVPFATLRGVDPQLDPNGRLPGNALFTFDECEGDSLLFALDTRGVSASTGSACQAGVPQPSHVLLAMGIDDVKARGALRFSLGAASTRQDVDQLIAVLPEAVERARMAGLTSVPRSSQPGLNHAPQQNLAPQASSSPPVGTTAPFTTSQEA